MKKILVLLVLTTGLLRAQSETVDLRSHGSLTVYLEDNWKISTSDFGDRAIVTIEPKDEANAACTLTVTYPESDRYSTKAKLKIQVEVASRQMEEGSVEGKSVARELNTQAGYGYYCNFTDPQLVGKPPEKGNFKTISVGMIHVTADVLIEFSITSDGFRTEPYQQLLGALEGLEYKPRRLATGTGHPPGSERVSALAPADTAGAIPMHMRAVRSSASCDKNLRVGISG